jgi:ABC-type lipoprotein release transport system permease subunit
VNSKTVTSENAVREPLARPGLLATLRVGWFLAMRQLWRSGRWTSALIVFIMTLTFLNLVVVNGILVGLIEGSSVANRLHHTGDVYLSTPPKKLNIERTSNILARLRADPTVAAVSSRLVGAGRLDANYKNVAGSNELPDSVSAPIVGISPADEDAVTRLGMHVVEGRYLDAGSFGEVLVGSSLLADYARTSFGGRNLLPDVHAGTKIRLTVGTNALEVTVRGVLKAKVGEIDQRVFIVDRDLRKLAGVPDLNVNEIAVKLKPGAVPEAVQASLLAAGFGQGAVVQTWVEAQGDFFRDLSRTFNMLGNFIGSIALIVASVTVFIVILINTLSRKKFIGVMKGIGINGRAIVTAYVIQAFAYAAAGTAAGLALLYLLIKPYFDAHPIDFPFSDGILSVPLESVLVRVGLLLALTALAGYLPATRIIRRNTLDTILGR